MHPSRPALHAAIASGVLWSLCRTWAGRLVGFVIYFQLARLLDAGEMGLFTTAFAIFVLLDILGDQGMVQAVVQHDHVDDHMLNGVLVLNLAATIAMVAALWSVADVVERLFRVGDLADVLRVGSLTLIFSAAGFGQEAMARRRFRFRLLALRTLVSTAASGAVGVVMAANGYGVWALVVQMFIAAVINVFALWLRPAWNIRCRPDVRSALRLAPFGLQVMGMRLIEYGGSRGIELLIAFSLGASALGIFAIGTKLHYILLQLLGMALVDVAQAGFARMTSEPEQLRQAYLTSIGNVALLATPVWILVAACAPELIALAFGGSWAPSAEVLLPFALLGALQVVQNFDTALLNASGRPLLSILLGTCHAGCGLLAVWVFQRWGLASAVLAYCSSQVLLTPLNLWVLRRALGLAPTRWLGQIWAPALAGTGAWLAVDQVRGVIENLPLPARLICLGAAGGAAYLLAIVLLDRDRIVRLLNQALGMRVVRHAE